MTNPWWLLDRASGIVALVLLTASVLMGVLTWSRWQTPRWPRFMTTGLHRNVSLLAVVFLTVHVVTAVADSYVPIDIVDAFIPFSSRYETFWLGIGALAVDMLIAVTITSLLQKRMGWKTFRAVHWLSYAAWPVAVLHSAGMGTDAGSGWFSVLGLACVASVTSAVAARLVLARDAPVRQRVLVGAAAMAGLLALSGLWVTLGAKDAPAQAGGERSALAGLASAGAPEGSWPSPSGATAQAGPAS